MNNMLSTALSRLRPANMRTVHGLRHTHPRGCLGLSVSSAECVEELLADPWMCRETGAGMDAPQDMPTGSIKAFFGDNGYGQQTRFFGLCQRTTGRK